jgi:hypothetical protein
MTTKQLIGKGTKGKNFVYFEISSQYLSVGSKEIHAKCQSGLFPDQYSNLRAPNKMKRCILLHHV